MDVARLLALTGFFLSAMLGGLYATSHAAGPAASVHAEAPTSEAPTDVLTAPSGLASQQPASQPAAALPLGRDVPFEATEDLEDDIFVDPISGVTLGPVSVRPVALSPSSRGGSARADATQPSRERRAPRAPRAPVQRLDADPGRNVIATARGMISRNETLRGSCYAYLSEVFHRAGNDGWRTRTIVYEAGPSGPYADLDLIRPGDWLYIVNNPDSTPVGTHSVLFVGWEDRASGYARTISHPGWSAGDASGRESTYYITRTYRIIRPR